MGRALWQIGYAYRFIRSPYRPSLFDAWTEACASWEMNDDERCGEPMPTPADALYHDQAEWRDQ